jgi:hypothetical protein
MAWRIGIAIGSAAFIACASLAGLGEGDGENAPSTNGGSVNSAPAHADAGGFDASDGQSVDASHRDADARATCEAPKGDNGSACDAGSACCSGACDEWHLCGTSCKATGASCNLVTSRCCVGSFCAVSAGAHCALCIKGGAHAEDRLLLGVNADSCCSRRLSANKKTCAN